MEERIIYQLPDQNSSLRRGEILTNVCQYRPIASDLSPDSEELSFTRTIHSYVMVVTQDCDLDWDYKKRTLRDSTASSILNSKLLNSVLLCEVGSAEEIKNSSDHGISSKIWNLIKSHRHERYYFLEKIPYQQDLGKEQLPELTVDFKKVFGVETETLYRQIELGIAQRRTFLTHPYGEHLSQRYQSFHGRVALPFQYESERA